MLLIRLLAAATLLVTAPALAQGTAGAATAKPAAVPAEKKLCRRGDVPTGSMMPPKRICHTAAEWSAIDAQAAAAAGPNANGRFTQDPAMSNIPTGTVN